MYDGSYERCQRGSVYILKGSIVTGSTTISSASSDVDLAHSWHACLGHISEKGMTILSKRAILDSEGTCKLDFCDHFVFSKQKRVSFFYCKTLYQGYPRLYTF